jgi:hypothetical protein
MLFFSVSHEGHTNLRLRGCDNDDRPGAREVRWWMKFKVTESLPVELVIEVAISMETFDRFSEFW